MAKKSKQKAEAKTKNKAAAKSSSKGKKPSGSNDFLLLHAEKLVLGLAVVLTGVFIWLGYTTPQYKETTPPDLVRQAESAKQFIEKNDHEKLRSQAGVSSSRMSLIPYAMDVLARLIRTFKPKDIAISSYGIREGLLYEQMSQELRDRDPLIEASLFAESKDARLPGFGRNLYDFVMPLFKSAPPSSVRLIKAACLLHDVSWRAHPDYRAEVCFDNVTRANLGGLKHSERVFIGLALQHRYRNKREGNRFAPLYDLLDEKGQKEAEILGKAMRFGAMLWMHNDANMGRLKFYPKKRELELYLPEAAAPLFSEVAEARLNSLANALKSETRVIIRG